MQKLLLTLFFPELKNFLHYNKISLLTYLGSEISQPIFSLVLVLFLVLALYFAVRFLLEGFILSRSLQSMMRSEEGCRRPLENALLAAALKKNRVTLFATDKVTIPMATYAKAIFIPHAIVKNFPQGEFEAIVAHELEHVLWRDQAVRLFVQLISAIFWWVPTNSWQKKLEFDQEIACDQSILKYGFKEEFLASALVKVAASAKEKNYQAFCYLSQEKHPTLRRVQLMLGLASTRSNKRCELASYAVVVITSLIGLACTLWLK